MIKIAGVGWVGKGIYGCKHKKTRQNYADIKSLYSQLRNDKILPDSVKNFGRFDLASKLTCCSAALALYDAEMPGGGNKNKGIGIISTNTDGCLDANVCYFKDYVENKRKSARGNLFVYTLPSSSIAEAAIHFKCHGPLFYVGFQKNQVAELLRYAERIILQTNVAALLAVKTDRQKSVCFVVTKDGSGLSGKSYDIKKIISEYKAGMFG